MEKEEKIKHLLRIVKLRINFSLTLLVLTILTFVYIELMPEHDKVSVTKTDANADPISDYSVDPSEIKDGIHVPSGLIADKNFELVLSTCSGCHSIEVVKQNRATKQGWKDMITWMQKTQGLWDLKENEEPILEYLSKNYAPVNTGRRKNLENIVWYELKD